jgi:DeoR/GlpR family transcriptional regulator of sugar metabolism
MTPSRPGKQERHRRIVAELKANPTVRISSLAEEFSVSTETVRRDIDELSARGLVNRTYGGAASTSMSREPAVHARGGIMTAERERIARLAAASVEPGEVLMVDAGSTTALFARRLAVEGTEATVITNSLSVASALAEAAAVQVMLCPGQYLGREHAVYGPETADHLAHYNADRAILGASGLTAEGATEAHAAASWVKRAMLDRAGRSSLLLDHGKFGQPFLEVVCPLARFDELVTDARPPAELAKALEQAGVRVRLA